MPISRSGRPGAYRLSTAFQERSQAPQWLLAADPLIRKRLSESQARSEQSRRIAAELFAQIDTLYEFAKPSVDRLLQAHSMPYPAHYYEFVRFRPDAAALPDQLDTVLISSQTLLEAVLGNFRLEDLVTLAANPYNRLAVNGWKDHFPAKADPRRNASDSIYDMPVPPLSPAQLVLWSRNQDLGGNYRTYLTQRLKARKHAERLRPAKMNAARDILEVEAHIAVLKGNIGPDAYAMLRRLLEALQADPSSEPNISRVYRFDDSSFDQSYCQYLRLDGLQLSEVVLIGPDQDMAPCVVYMPGHPEHPLREYPSRRGFFADLDHQLSLTSFQAFFQVFVPLAEREHYSRALHATDAFNRPIKRRYEAVRFHRNLFWAQYYRMVERAVADARVLAVPSLEIDSEQARVQLAGRRELIQTHLSIAAGPGCRATEEEEQHAPSSFIEPLRWVRLPDLGYRQWRVSLNGYALSTQEASRYEMIDDKRGLYQLRNGSGSAIRINGRFYKVGYDLDVAQGASGLAIAKFRILHPQDPTAYCPILEHNGWGAWHHSLEHPEQWSRATLLRRLGHITDGFSDDELALIGRISGVSNQRLRQVYRNDLAPPGLLLDALARARAHKRTQALMEKARNGIFDDKPLAGLFLQRVKAQLAQWTPAPGRVRRSPQPPVPTSPLDEVSLQALFEQWALELPEVPGAGQAPGPDAPAVPAVTVEPLPAPLFEQWYGTIAQARFELESGLAQPSSTAQDLALLQHFPDLPPAVRAEIAAASLPAELQELSRNQLAPHIRERVRQEQGFVRLARAIEGLAVPYMTSDDTAMIALELLTVLPYWQQDNHIELRQGSAQGRMLHSTIALAAVLAEIENRPAPRPTLVYHDSEHGWAAVNDDGSILRSGEATPLGLYRVLLQAMGAAQRTAFGLGLAEELRLQQLLVSTATQLPNVGAYVLGIELPVPWLWPQPWADAGRRNFPMDGTGGLCTGVVDQEMLRALFPLASEQDLQHLSLEILGRGETVDNEARRLEQELDHLRQVLTEWEIQATSEDARLARQLVTLRLIDAWQERVPRNYEGGTRLGFSARIRALDALPDLPCDFPHVHELDLANLPLAALPEGFLEHFPNLRYMNLDNADIQRLPQDMSHLRELRALDLTATNLGADTLGPLATLPRLEELSLRSLNGSRAWTAQTTEVIAQIRTLRLLSLSTNFLTFAADVLVPLGQLTNLEALDLSENRIILTPATVNALANLVQLRSLILSDNPLQLAPDVSRMAELRVLDLDHTDMTQWPRGLENLTNIREAFMAHSPITDIPVGAGRIHGLVLAREFLSPVVIERLLAERPFGPPPWSEAEVSSNEEPPGAPFNELYQGLAAEQRNALMTLANSAEHNASVEALMHILRRAYESIEGQQDRASMLARVQAVFLASLEEDMRGVLYALAQDLGTCEDGSRVIFSNMEGLVDANRIISYTPARSRPAELVALSSSRWRLQSLVDYVGEPRARGWNVPGRTIDIAEIELYFRVHLAQPLDLRHQPSHMRFTGMVNWITEDMLRSTAELIRARQPSELPGYMVDQLYWMRYLRYAQPQAMAEIDRWKSELGSYLEDVNNGETPSSLSPEARRQLETMLSSSGNSELVASIDSGFAMTSGQYVELYAALNEAVRQAHIELTRQYLPAS